MIHHVPEARWVFREASENGAFSGKQFNGSIHRAREDAALIHCLQTSYPPNEMSKGRLVHLYLLCMRHPAAEKLSTTIHHNDLSFLSSGVDLGGSSSVQVGG